MSSARRCSGLMSCCSVQDMGGVLSAREFVWWYNGHPDYRHLPLNLANAHRRGSAVHELPAAASLLVQQQCLVHASAASSTWRTSMPCCSVAVLGLGNVAVDCARVLLQPVDRLACTDIASHALEQLRHSAVQEVHLVGRRGPVQVMSAQQQCGCLALFCCSTFCPA